MPVVFAAHSSSVLIDGQPIEGVQGIDYRVVRQQGHVFALGSSERLTTYYGETHVDGRVTVASTSAALDTLVTSGDAFQIVGNLAHGGATRTISFDDCRMARKEFNLLSGGHGETVYLFTATRVRESDTPPPAPAA
jgi:hypothetical protein